LYHVVWYKFTDVSELLTAPVIRVLMMEAASTSETSVNFKHLRNIGKLLPDYTTTQKTTIFILATMRTSNLTLTV
jgi:hypothetical protein